MLEFLGDAAGFMASGGLGAIVGGVFSWLDKREEREQMKLRLAHEERMADIDVQLQQAEHDHALAVADKNLEQTRVEADIAADIAETELAKASVNAQAQPSGNPLIDGALRFVRPIITAYLLWMVTDIYRDLETATGGIQALPVEAAGELYQYVVMQILFLGTTATVFWFGSRRNSRSPIKR